MNLPQRQILRTLAITFLLSVLSCTACSAQTTDAPSKLPSNYKTIFENRDLLVLHVHYGPHEFVPMHDHSAYPTVYVYLNDSGVIQIKHAPPVNFSVNRPPTHTGAFRISPSMIERHSITNLSATPSDFLRIELKTIPIHDIKQASRSPLPSPLPGTHSEFKDAAVRIDRIVCPATTACSPSPTPARSLLVAITQLQLQTPGGKTSLHRGDVFWMPSNSSGPTYLSAGAQALRITLLYPEGTKQHPTQP